MNTADTRHETIKSPDDPSKLILIDHTEESAEPTQIIGHMVYVRMTERAEKIGSIYLPQKSRDDNCTLWEIIAIGRECGHQRQKEKRHKGLSEFDLNPETTFKVGDTVLIPEKATGQGTGYQYFVKNSPVSTYEGLVDEGLIMAVVE